MNSARQIDGLPPIVGAGARVLILGSMPGQASLQRQQYYAHPRNLFWPFMERLFGIDASLSYERRCRLLLGNGLAVWDVVACCVRRGSLDADIEGSTVIANDFDGFLAARPGIQRIFFNGAMAAATYQRHVLRSLPARSAGIPTIVLPSTSPANASIRLDEKLRRWTVLSQ